MCDHAAGGGCGAVPFLYVTLYVCWVGCMAPVYYVVPGCCTVGEGGSWEAGQGELVLVESVGHRGLLQDEAAACAGHTDPVGSTLVCVWACYVTSLHL